MGALLQKQDQIYIFYQKGSYTTRDIKKLDNLQNFSLKDNAKIIMPITKFLQQKKYISYHHRKIVFLIDNTQMYQKFLVNKTNTLPIIHEQQLVKNQLKDKLVKLKNKCQFCPFPIILQKFDDFFVKNYINAFNFYGIQVCFYQKLEDYLNSNCTIPYLICSNNQIQILASKVLTSEFNAKKSKIMIFCFCSQKISQLLNKSLKILNECKVQITFFSNILQIIQRFLLINASKEHQFSKKIEKPFLFMNQKQSEIEHFRKISKKIQKSIRNIKIIKVLHKQSLVQKVSKNQYSLILIGKDDKQLKGYLELCQKLQGQGLEDRVIFIRRENQEIQKTVHQLQRLMNQPKFIQKSLFEKSFIFYGSIENFKYFTSKYPFIKFKLFVDCLRQKEKIKQYCRLHNQVIISTVRICQCITEFKQILRCKVILINLKLSLFKTLERIDASQNCPKQRWICQQRQIIEYFKCQNNFAFNLNYQYYNKKLSYTSKILTEIFFKFKQKKHFLYNIDNNSFFMFFCQYFTLDQIINLTLKYFNNKLLGNYNQVCLLPRLKYQLFEQLSQLQEIKNIQKESLQDLLLSQVQNVYELSNFVLELFFKYPCLREETNNNWKLFLFQDRAEFLINTPVLLFLLILSFNKTNFFQYTKQKIQSGYLMIKELNFNIQQSTIDKFKSKNKNSFAYTSDFLFCQLIDSETQITGPIIKIQGSQLSNFNAFMPIWKKGKYFIIPPLIKVQINTKDKNEYLFKLSMTGQQTFLQKFFLIFMTGQSSNQLKLIKKERQSRKLDLFLDSMEHSKLQTAIFLLKNIIKSQKFQNNQIINVFQVICHLKKNQFHQAEAKIRLDDDYYELLTNFLSLCKKGETNEETHKLFNQQYLNSNKRIQDPQQQYQVVDDTIVESSSLDQNIKTNPEMFRKNSNDYKFPHPSSLKRSPSNLSQTIQNIKIIKLRSSPLQKNHPISTSLTDAASSYSKLQSGPRIMILPPSYPSKAQNNKIPFEQETFGNKKFSQKNIIRSNENDSQLQMNKNFTKQNTYQLESIELIQTPTLLKKKSLPYKHSNFFNNQIRKQDSKNQSNQQIYEKIDEICRTGSFNENDSEHMKVQTPAFQVKKRNDTILELNTEQSLQFCGQRIDENECFKNVSLFKIKINNQAKKDIFNIKPRNCRESIKISSNFLDPLDKQNYSLSQSESIKSNWRGNFNAIDRTSKKKLFTFSRSEDQDTLMQRFSIKSDIIKNLKRNSKEDEKSSNFIFEFDEQQERLLEELSQDKLSSIEASSSRIQSPQLVIQNLKQSFN